MGGRDGLSSQGQPQSFLPLSRPVPRPGGSSVSFWPQNRLVAKPAVALSGSISLVPARLPHLPRAAVTSLTEWMATVKGEGGAVCFVRSLPCLPKQAAPAGRMPEGALPSIKPNMTGAGRRVGFSGDRAMFPFPLPAGIRNSSVNLSAQSEQDEGNSAARGIAVRWQGKRRHTFQERK